MRVNNAIKAYRGTVMKHATGDNPNPLFALPEIKSPIISEKAKLKSIKLPETHMFDVLTEAGKTYVFYGL